MRRALKALAGSILIAPVLLIGGAPALAEEENLVPLELNVTQLERNVTPLEAVERDGAETAVTLQSDILFATGESELSPAAVARIGELVVDVPQQAEVAVDGHTDSIPYARGNQVLSEERAEAVAEAIRAARPDLTLTVTGHGDSKPVSTVSEGGQATPDDLARNRRVEIRYEG